MVFKPGQFIIRPKQGEVQGWHCGVYFSDDCVFHTTPEYGAHFTTLHGFALRCPVMAISAGVRTTEEYHSLLLRCRNLAGSPYSVFVNCEDIANDVRYGIRQSPTRDKIFEFGIVAGLVVAALNC